MDITKIAEAAVLHAKEVLGDEQLNNPETQTAKDAIIDDFTTGANWILEQQLEDKTDKNFEVVSMFSEYLNENYAIPIPDEYIESFFNA